MNNNNLEHIVLDNLLNVYFINKPNFKRKYVLLATKYGSTDHNFVFNNKEYHTPAGIAHFLEHKLFEMPDFSDAFTKLSKLGVSSNAYTSYNKTAYLFETTSNIIPPLNILLDFVFTPFFNEDSVEREKGIIVSEINMYKDYPDHQIDLNTLKNMYINSTLDEDIAGEEEDVLKTTPQDLLDNYNAFYNPANMYLVFVGEIDSNLVKNRLNEFFKDKSFNEFNTVVLDNIKNASIKNDTTYIKGNVVIDKFSYGIKNLVDNTLDNKERFKKEFCFESILYSLFSESSKIYQSLLDKKLITSNFYYRTDFDSDYSYAILACESKKPLSAINALNEVILNLDKNNISEESISLFKKSILGELYRCFDSVSQLGNAFLSYICNNISIFDVKDIVSSITLEDVYSVLDTISINNTTSTIMNKK